MSKKKRRKKSILNSTFYRVYFALVVLALVAIVAATFWLRGVLEDYESAQPVYVAQKAARLFVAGDYDSLYDRDTSAQQIAQGDRDFYVQSMTELTQGKAIAWSEAFSPSEDERRYTVTADGERLATFTLVPSGQSTPRGNRLWTLGSVTTNVSLQQPEPEPGEPDAEPAQTWQCRVTAPKGYVVTADGETLGPDNAQTSEKNLFEAGFLPESEPNPVLVEYVFDAASESPALAATDDTGAAARVEPVAQKERAWNVPLREDETYRQQYGKAAYSLAKQVAKYISGDAGKKSIQRACARNSPADGIFENLGNRYTTPHSGLEFRNEEISEFYKISDSCFTCHVSFDFVLKTKTGELVYPTAYTFCVILQDGKGRLYNLLIY